MKKFKIKEEMAVNAGGVGEYSTPKAFKKYRIKEIKVNKPPQLIFPYKINNEEEWEKFKKLATEEKGWSSAMFNKNINPPFYAILNNNSYGIYPVYKKTNESSLGNLLHKIKSLKPEQQAELRIFLKDKFNISEIKDLFESHEPEPKDFPIKISSYEQAQLIGQWLQKYGYNLNIDQPPFNTKPLLNPFYIKADGKNIHFDKINEIIVNKPGNRLRIKPKYKKSKIDYKSNEYLIDDNKFPEFNKGNHRIVRKSGGGSETYTFYHFPQSIDFVNKLKQLNINFTQPHPNKNVPVLPKGSIIINPYKPRVKNITENKITCSCGWSWNLVDGGDDPYTCHKCGKANNINEIKINKPGIIAFPCKILNPPQFFRILEILKKHGFSKIMITQDKYDGSLDRFIEKNIIPFQFPFYLDLNKHYFNSIMVSKNPLKYLKDEDKSYIITESKYTQFKQSTTKPNPKQVLHKAIKEIQLKLDEVNKLIDFTSRIKGELTEGDQEIEYLKRTKDNINKIQNRLKEVFNKLCELDEIKVNNPLLTFDDLMKQGLYGNANRTIAVFKQMGFTMNDYGKGLEGFFKELSQEDKIKIMNIAKKMNK